MEKRNDEQKEQTKKTPDVYTLPVLEPRRGWDIVRLPNGYIIEMVR